MRARLAIASRLSEGGLAERLLGPSDDPAARRTRRRLLVIVAVGAGLRLAWVLFASRDPQGLVDPAFYRRYAEQLAAGDGYVLVNGEPTAYYPVGYPAALAALFTVVLRTPLPDDLALATGLFQLVLGVATIVLTYVVGRRLFDDRVGLIAAGIVAVFPNLIFHTAVPLTETLFIFLVMAALAVLLVPDWSEEQPTTWRLIAFGVLVGMSMLVRPISLLLLPAALVAWLVAGVGTRRALFRVAAAALAAALVIAPWTVRNLVVMDAPVVISTNLGDNLCIGNQAEATGGFVVTDECFAHNQDVPNPEGEVERDAENRRRAVTYALGHPLDEIRLAGWKAVSLFEDDHDGLSAAESYGNDPFLADRTRTMLATVADGFYYAVVALALLGAPFVVSRREPRRLFFALATLGLTLVPLAFFGDSRFHVPSLPLAAVFAATTLSVVLEGRERSTAAPPP